MLALVLVAVSVGFSNLAASVGVGARGVNLATRLRVLLVFGVLEAMMPIVGLLAGQHLATVIGAQSRWLVAMLLAAVGGYGLRDAISHREAEAREPAAPAQAGELAAPAQAGELAVPAQAGELAVPAQAGEPAVLAAAGTRRAALGRNWFWLVLSGLALSLDNLVAGFALGAYRVPIWAGAITFGLVSAVMSLVGLEFGARIGERAGVSGELAGALVLIGVGAAIGLGALS